MAGFSDKCLMTSQHYQVKMPFIFLKYVISHVHVIRTHAGVGLSLV